MSPVAGVNRFTVPLVDSLLSAIVRTDGDVLVLHVGERPYVVAPTRIVPLLSRPLTAQAVNGIVEEVLSPDSLQSLKDVGAVEQELPAVAGPERFTGLAAQCGSEIWLEIRRHRASAVPPPRLEARPRLVSSNDAIREVPPRPAELAAEAAFDWQVLTTGGREATAGQEAPPSTESPTAGFAQPPPANSFEPPPPSPVEPFDWQQVVDAALPSANAQVATAAHSFNAPAVERAVSQPEPPTASFPEPPRVSLVEPSSGLSGGPHHNQPAVGAVDRRSDEGGVGERGALPGEMTSVLAQPGGPAPPGAPHQSVAGEQTAPQPTNPPVSGSTARVARENLHLEILEDLARGLIHVPGINAAVVLTHDGFVIEGASRGGRLDAEAVAAAVSSTLGPVGVMGRELGAGEISKAMFEFEGATVMLSRVSADILLAVVAEVGASLGNIRLQVKKRTSEVEQAMGF